MSFLRIRRWRPICLCLNLLASYLLYDKPPVDRHSLSVSSITGKACPATAWKREAAGQGSNRFWAENFTTVLGCFRHWINIGTSVFWWMFQHFGQVLWGIWYECRSSENGPSLGILWIEYVCVAGWFWEGNPLALSLRGKMEELVLSIRKRKNLKLQMPLLADYLDKL